MMTIIIIIIMIIIKITIIKNIFLLKSWSMVTFISLLAVSTPLQSAKDDCSHTQKNKSIKQFLLFLFVCCQTNQSMQNQSIVDISLAATDQWNAIYYRRSTSKLWLRYPSHFWKKSNKTKATKNAKRFSLSTNKQRMCLITL